MLAKRKEILSKIPQYHKDVFIFSHLRAIISVDKIYISAKHCRGLFGDYFYKFIHRPEFIKKYPDICYFIALCYKARYLFDKKIIESPESKINSLYVYSDNMYLFNIRIQKMFKHKHANDDKNNDDCDKDDCDKDDCGNAMLVNIMKLLGFRNIDSGVLKNFVRHRYAINSRNAKTSPINLSHNDDIWICIQFSDIIDILKKSIENIQPQTQTTANDIKILLSINKLSTDEICDKVIKNFRKRPNEQYKNAFERCLKMFDIYKESICQYTTKHYADICSKIELPYYNFIDFLVTFRKFIFDGMPYCEIYPITTSMISINTFKSKPKIIHFNTKQSVYELFAAYSNYVPGPDHFSILKKKYDNFIKNIYDPFKDGKI